MMEQLVSSFYLSSTLSSPTIHIHIRLKSVANQLHYSATE